MAWSTSLADFSTEITSPTRSRTRVATSPILFFVSSSITAGEVVSDGRKETTNSGVALIKITGTHYKKTQNLCTYLYTNYPPEQLVDIVARILAMVPPWTCVYRVQRDIPMPLITSGVEKGNLRELALARMDDLGLKCCDVRTHEAGVQDIYHKIKPEEVELVRCDYTANEGWETFLSYEDTRQGVLVGLLRLRKCGRNVTCPELMGRCSIVRELHVYGIAVPVHGRDADKLQHQGYGSLLMEEAEQIARREHRSTKIAVISGVGTRHYSRKLGYQLEGPYMVKSLAL